MFKRVLIECSELAVVRTNKLDVNTKKYVFLECCKLVNKYKVESDFYKRNNKMKQFYKAFQTENFRAWQLASKL